MQGITITQITLSKTLHWNNDEYFIGSGNNIAESQSP